MVKQIKAQASTDAGLIEECKKETNCGDCEPINWTTPSKGKRIEPPAHTVAVVVDVVQNLGAVRIFAKDTDKRIDAIGKKEAAGRRVIVPWDGDWWFRASGTPQVGYIIEKSVILA